MIPTRRAEDLFAGWWELICRLGAVPRALVWDGEGAIGRWRGGRVELTKECQAFRGVLATKVIVCKPADPEAKGLIERSHDYLERSFLPGRTFASPADFNTQISDWLAVVNTRTRRALGCAPTDRIDADRAAMLSLPPVAPATGWCSSLRLPPDHYIQFLTAMTTRCTRPRWDAGCWSGPTWSGCRRSATGRPSPSTPGSGRPIKRSPIRHMWMRQRC